MGQLIQPLPSSFRDPSGYVFQKDGVLYRQVNKVYKEDFDCFINSGCYTHLATHHRIIPHSDIDTNMSGSDNWYRTLRPERVPFISYPYEWCFDMVKDAALLTLQIAKEAIPFGVSLKDATPFNVQWLNGKPIFIDSLSFERYQPLRPWIAYRQFCENFLSPLLISYYSGQPLQALLLTYPDGIPLSIVRKMLPWQSKFSLHVFLHIHLHERLASKAIGKNSTRGANFSEKKLLRLLESLQSLVQSLEWKPSATAWGNYYAEAEHRADYLESKYKIVASWIAELPSLCKAMDAGANEGRFSFMLAENNLMTIAVDADHSALNRLYRATSKRKESKILPLAIDFANPSPAIGFNSEERLSFLQRAHADVTLALALVHHLAIGRNIPLEKIASLFQGMTKFLIVEFVPKSDPKIQLMLKQKQDVYYDYGEENFLRAFNVHFSLLKKESVEGSGRIVYLMKNHNG